MQTSEFTLGLFGATFQSTGLASLTFLPCALRPAAVVTISILVMMVSVIPH